MILTGASSLPWPTVTAQLRPSPGYTQLLPDLRAASAQTVPTGLQQSSLVFLWLPVTLAPTTLLSFPPQHLPSTPALCLDHRHPVLGVCHALDVIPLRGSSLSPWQPAPSRLASCGHFCHQHHPCCYLLPTPTKDGLQTQKPLHSPSSQPLLTPCLPLKHPSHHPQGTPKSSHPALSFAINSSGDLPQLAQRWDLMSSPNAGSLGTLPTDHPIVAADDASPWRRTAAT